MDISRLDFALPDACVTGKAATLASPPAFSLSHPEAGWIRLAIEHPDADFPPVMMSKVFSPLAPLWAWSLALAWGMEPASCRIDEEGSAVYLIAKAGTEGRLSFTLVRTQYGCRNEPERLLQALTWEVQAETVRALLPLLPIGVGSCFIDEQGRRARLVHRNRRRWVLCWEDGRLSEGDCFYQDHRPVRRWPVAEGPVFDEAALDAIDRRRLAFMRLGVSPYGVVCPCCGYPCMDDDPADIYACDICDWPVWTLLCDKDFPETDPLEILKARTLFLQHGDCHAQEPKSAQEANVLRHLRAPQRMAMAQMVMAEWDDWLANPDLDHTPEPVWMRMSR
ncbi:hypothetical protein C3497_12525 [Zoogloeaceae bacteirum Par-f-2]|nr:hypothetical protein C3497_12525 [Zoogloeaceae bacteirum Par-f-2]